MNTIPNQVHRIAPADKAYWPTIWQRCIESWHHHFPDYQHHYYTDEDDIHALIRNQLPEYFDCFERLPAKIMRIEFARYALLYIYGGIYADMDIYCYRSFDEQFTDSDRAYLVELPLGQLPLENSLMAAPAHHPFFKACLDTACQRLERIERQYPSKIEQLRNFRGRTGDRDKPYLPQAILYVTATELVSDLYGYYADQINTLDGFLFNMKDHSYDSRYRCKHVSTKLWGEADYERIPDFENYDFYYDYTQGAYRQRDTSVDLNTPIKKAQRQAHRGQYG